MADGGTDAAKDALTNAGERLRPVEQGTDHGFGDRLLAADLDASRAMRALDTETAEVVAGDERAAAGGAIEDEVHARFASSGRASACRALTRAVVRRHLAFNALVPPPELVLGRHARVDR